ncbi:MAG: tripartite tricarboxylate transporter TctB family protein [Candidatus Rokubacteria bacterium]|nr:tripartite tricarboxylate transporter TctB family protein [Candidatus Rokubacteria bacterium]
MRGRDRAAAAVLLVFGLLALEEARKLRFGAVAKPGPGFFPVVLAAALTVVCAALLIVAWRARDGGGDVAGLAWWKIAATIVALFAYASVLERAGFVIATFGLLLFFFKVLEGQRWLPALAGSLATAFVTYVVFKVWLNVQLPAGPWSG